MSAKEIKRIIDNGIFYTPNHISRLLADKAIDHPCVSVLDPSCGEGALLGAAKQRCRKLGARAKPHLTGCDIFEPKQNSIDLDEIDYIQKDFFRFNTEKQFDVILTNPPYIQFGRLQEEYRNELHKEYAEPLGIHKNSDLWVYFLLKSIKLLKEGGSIAAVIPWSLLEADFAFKLRELFAEKFKTIDVLVLRHAHFDTTEKRVLLVWLKDFGNTSKSINLAFADDIEEDFDYIPITKEQWAQGDIFSSALPDVPIVLTRMRQDGFVQLGTLSTIVIGIVTGANGFFVKEYTESLKLGFSDSALLPILTSVNDLEGLEAPQETDKCLLRFDRLTQRRRQYLQKGKKNKIHLGSHCRRRAKKSFWYDIPLPEIPDAFFTYRVSKVPFMVLNSDELYATNSLHSIYFNQGMTLRQKRMIQISSLSAYSQLTLELNARHYGNGIIKMEPTALKNTLVYCSKNEIDSTVYNEISNLINDGKKDEAMLRSTNVISEVLGLDGDVSTQCIELLSKIRELRGCNPITL